MCHSWKGGGCHDQRAVAICFRCAARPNLWHRHRLRGGISSRRGAGWGAQRFGVVLGYTSETIYEIETTPARPAVVNVALSEAAIAVDAAEVVAESRATVDEAPLSVRSIGTNEIKRNPGGGRDISRALRSLPGVAAIPSFRNDIVIRGGAPNENRFYLDGIEIPNINHFATQGASGGPVGMINVDLVEGVDFYAGAFPAARGNALSSVMEFRFKDPRSDQWTANAVLGTSDLGVTVEGPTGENSSLIASFRRSYLQLLFEVIGLPFLPIYNDYQYKWTWRPDDRNAVTVLGLGALDDFELNLDLASDTEAPDYLNQVAILDVLPISEQWNYMQGVKWDRYMNDGKWTFVLSRNMLNNSAFKHVDNDVDLPKTLDYVSQEIENKFRAERFRSLGGGWKLSGGVSAEYAKYNNSTRNTVFVPEVGSVDVTFGSDFKMAKYGAFAQASRPLLENRLTLSAGMRVDGALLLGASEGLALPEGEPLANPLDQFSPRVSASWSFAPGWTWNANAGMYHQLPAYTILGYAGLDADSSSTLLNWTDGLTFTTNRQLVLGIRREIASRNAAVSVEGFYKGYTGSPASANTGIALANLGLTSGSWAMNVSPSMLKVVLMAWRSCFNSVCTRATMDSWRIRLCAANTKIQATTLPCSLGCQVLGTTATSSASRAARNGTADGKLGHVCSSAEACLTRPQHLSRAC